MTKNQLITVPFHGNQLFIATHNDQPYTPMKPIVEGMGLDWRSQASKFRSNKERWGVVLITTPTNGSDQDAICLPLRKLPGWLMTLQPSRVAPEIREKVLTYQNECDDALWDYWTKGQATNPRPYSANPGDKLTKEQADALRDILTEAAQAMPKDLQGLVMREGWSKLKAHFKCSYRQIPQSEFTEAVSLLSRHIVHWKRAKVTDATVSPAPTFVPQCELPPNVQAALDCKAWELAAQAHKIIHEHLSIAVDTGCAIGHPVRFIHETDALARIAETKLDEAFTPFGPSLDSILRYAEGTAEVAREYADRIKIGVLALRGQGLLGPVMAAGKKAASSGLIAA
jgi:hypothetical protein